MFLSMRLLCVAGCTMSMVACGNPAGSVDHTGQPLEQSPPPTTIDVKVVPSHALEHGTRPNPADPNVAATLLAEGYGDYSLAAGDAVVARTVGDRPAPAMGPNPRRLVRFAHLADLQVVDDEAMTRAGLLDNRGATSAALRPQDPYLCHLANAAVRAISEHHAYDPLDFTLLGGDNIDNAQNNELDWLLDILGGNPVECDSGRDDDLVEGPDNDPKDRFDTVGLQMPWYWVTGNHDELVQGNLGVNAILRANAKGGGSLLGTRDYRRGGRVRFGIWFAPDARRKPLYPKELLGRIARHEDGHGLTEEQAATGKAFYHFDVPGTELRFVVMDTSAERGGAYGLLRRRDFDRFVRPALDEALQQGKLVVLASHHSIYHLTTNGGEFGTTAKDAMLSGDLRSALGEYPNVLFSFVGHAHSHSVRFVETSSGAGFWEVMTAAIADYPHQFRLVELWDADNGAYLLRATAVDVETTGDPLAEQGRALGLVDHTSGWATGGSSTWPEDLNVEVWIPYEAESPRYATAR